MRKVAYSMKYSDEQRIEKIDLLQEAIYDSRLRKNLYGPFDNAEDTVASMLED